MKRLIIAFLIAAAEAAVAFLTLDRLFRVIAVEPARLRERLRWHGALYATVAALSSAFGAWLQWRVGGPAGLVVAPLNPLPWWLLWRFGLRKQFTYLFKADGGRPVEPEGPDP